MILKAAIKFGRFAYIAKLVSASFLALLLLGRAELAAAQEVPGGCGVLRMQGRFGPYDYRPEKYIPDVYNNHALLLKTVEEFHFTADVESLRRGRNNATAGPDLGYTLHAFPNHHRALIAMMALGEKEKTSTPAGAYYSIECWLRRAVQWRPDDNIVRMIAAKYFVKSNRLAEAEQQLVIVAKNADGLAFTHNNIGLIYFEMKNYDMALTHAHIAYDLGLINPNLREQLKSVGRWSDLPAPAPADPAPSSPQ